MYRDGSNYKSAGWVVFDHPNSAHEAMLNPKLPYQGLSLAEIEQRLQARFEEGKYFVTGQLGIPSVAFYDNGRARTDDDHAWHEFVELEAYPYWDDYAQDERTLEQFLQEVEAVEQWNENLPEEKTFDITESEIRALICGLEMIETPAGLAGGRDRIEVVVDRLKAQIE